jgi:hypothetical protein
MTMARETFIQIRVSSDEKAQIEANAKDAGMVTTAFVRSRALGTVIQIDKSIVEMAANRTEPMTFMPRDIEAERAEIRRQLIPQFRCPRDCKPDWRPTSPVPRCPACNSKTVPA